MSDHFNHEPPGPEEEKAGGYPENSYEETPWNDYAPPAYTQQPPANQNNGWQGTGTQYPPQYNYNYRQGPYPPYYPPNTPPKQKMPTALKVFIFIVSFIAAGSIAGFFIYAAYTGITQSAQGGYKQFYNNDDLDEFFKQYEEQYGKKEEQPGNGVPPSAQIPKNDNKIEQPDIDITPFTSGITINPKPKTKELTAEEVYEKVVQSTVGIVATIPLADGSTEDSGGTGMFISADGYILTNSHVIGNTKGSGIKITTHDGQEYPAVVVSFDKTTDLAILKTEDHGFTPVEFGSADDLNIGEWVIAIGNPGGAKFSGSLTRGVISGLDRSVGSYSSNGMTYIQTDAAINPGNSGGPLVNMYGQVVGINSSKIIAQYYEGMGFSIPVTKAKEIVDQLLSSGYVSGRTRLGITGQNVLYSTPGGVSIVAINDESSFTGTNAQVGDVITNVDGVDITSLTVLADTLLNYSPGDKVEITLYRPDTEEEITVTATLLEDKGETQG